MHLEDYGKTALVISFGLYEWLFVTFGLCNIPTTFHHFMEEILEPIRSFVAELHDDMSL